MTRADRNEVNDLECKMLSWIYNHRHTLIERGLRKGCIALFALVDVMRRLRSSE